MPLAARRSVALLRSLAVVTCLSLAELGCSGSFWLGHDRGHGGGGGAGSLPPVSTADDGGAPPDEPPSQGGGVVVVGSGSDPGSEPMYECTEDSDCAPVDCTCDDGESFTVSICDNGVCLNPDDCPYLCGDAPLEPDDAGTD